jgi:hypothetical protein
MVVAAGALAFAQQPGSAVVSGEVTDTSGGVLPGVTVTAAAADGRILGQTITNDIGQYALSGLPPTSIRITFELQGFETSAITVAVPAAGTVNVVERLRLGRMTDEVVVIGKMPPPPLPPVPDPPPLAPVVPIDTRELETVCKPAKPGSTLGPLGTIRSHRYDYGRTLYAKGDTVVITGGARNGLEVGRNLVVLRYFRTNTRAAQFPELGEHTAGLVQIVGVKDEEATGVVVHTCNELRQGDLLVAFIPEYKQPNAPLGDPVFDEAAKILFADAGQLLGAPRRWLVIDRGSEQGFRAGQRITLFRHPAADALTTRPQILGEAIVVSVKPNSSTVRVVSATDAINFGDLAAPQR